MRSYVICLLFATYVWAGGSIFGTQPTGDQLPNGGVRTLGLGGAGLATWDSIGTHGENPAASAYMTGTVLRVGFYTGIYGTSDEADTDYDSEFGWQSFRLMLNIHPRYKMGFGFDPLSRTDVRTFANDSLRFETDSGSVYESFERRNVWLGSATDVRWDHTLKLSDRVALGASAAFSSTYLEINNSLDFPTASNSGGARDVLYHDVQRFHGFWGGLSVLVRPTSQLSIGGYWKSDADGKWEYERRVNHGGEYQFSETDGSRPGEFGVGFGYRWARNWSSYADMRMQNWKSEHYGPAFADKQLVDKDALSIMFGAEKQGGTRITDEGFDRWDYRAGLAFRQHPWQIPVGTSFGDATETALSLGISIPLAQRSGKLHTALEFGMRTASDADTDENFVRFYLQLDMHERWFHRERRKLRD